MGDAALQKKMNGGSTKLLLLTCSSEKALHGEEALTSVISWRSGRRGRVCRSGTSAEIRGTVELEDELFALRYQCSEMMSNTALANSPGEFARLELGVLV